MEVKKVKPDNWCCNCDQKLATVEISNNGSFKLFWACGPQDREFCLCDDCFKELRNKMNAITF